MEIPYRKTSDHTQKPKEKTCKMITKRTGNKIERSFEGECTPQEIKALAQNREDIDEEQEQNFFQKRD